MKTFLIEREIPGAEELTDDQLDSLRHFIRQTARDSAAPRERRASSVR